ncbi:MAG: tRNA (adenosine(37)-N6)-dimethylallyltransferase MiaA [Bacteroidales bacterium]|nr:tRNA (adenosine(37)-N6)-dimethylallyltransferase MiaA [Bacteroidales bacterium]
MIINEPLLVVVAGPTAVGKTSVSIQLAHHFNTEIISADSRQFYREMKIGTATPSREELLEIPHHFIGHLSVGEPYNVSRFETDALNKLTEMFRNHKVVIMTGGSGLYIDAVCQGIDQLPDPDPVLRQQLKDLLQDSGITALQQKLQDVDPDYYNQIDPFNPARLIRALEVTLTTGIPYSAHRTNSPKPRPFKILKTALTLPREILNQRINQRVDYMMGQGWLDEAIQLLPFQHLNALNTVGYKELFHYLKGAYSLEMAVEKIKINTRRYAKRQMTWFRKDPAFTWYAPDDLSGIISNIFHLLSPISSQPNPR